MSSTTLTIYNPLKLEEVLPEERLALQLPDIGYPQHVVVVPWRSLLRLGKLDLIKTLPKEICRSTILTFEFESEEIKKAILELGFSVLFCTSTNKCWPIRNFCYPDYISDRIISNEKKDIDFSLVGWNNNYLRNCIFERFVGVPSVIKRDFYSYGVEERNKETNEYIDILSRSRFSLCPKGVGTGTKRIWESLQAGAIPIIISDEWLPPNCFNWKETAIFLTEHEVSENRNKIPVSIVLPQGKEEIIRKNCYKAAKLFKNPLFLAEYIKKCLT